MHACQEITAQLLGDESHRGPTGEKANETRGESDGEGVITMTSLKWNLIELSKADKNWKQCNL